MTVIGIIIYISFFIMSVFAFFWIGRKLDVGEEGLRIYGIIVAAIVSIHIILLYFLFRFFGT